LDLSAADCFVLAYRIIGRLCQPATACGLKTGSWQSGEARKVKEETRDVKRNVPEGRRLAADEGNGDLGVVIVFGQFVTLGFIFANISVTAVQMAVTETG
jgi:hypothetical protein